jgi:hypothetical protein
MKKGIDPGFKKSHYTNLMLGHKGTQFKRIGTFHIKVLKDM